MALDARINLMITSELKEQLKLLAVQEDRSVQWLINHALKRLVAEQLKDK